MKFRVLTAGAESKAVPAHDPILDKPTDYSKNANRLSNIRWPIGEEPYADTEGTDGSIGARHIDSAKEAEGQWTNVKLDVTEHPDPDPDQRSLLHGGAEVILPCFHCGTTQHVGASKTAQEVLEEGGYKFKEDADVAHASDRVVALVCLNGHVTQMREDMLAPLIKRR